MIEVSVLEAGWLIFLFGLSVGTLAGLALSYWWRSVNK
jgi:hypothetical protein